jgi:GST-like protein
MAETYRLLGCWGCGSIIVEAALRVAGIPYDYEEVDYEQPGPGRDRLFALNPLGQVPTLVLPDGSILTESAAIIMVIDDLAPGAGLAPPAGSEERLPFLRWLIFMVAAIYPTFTYGDDPKKWLPGLAQSTLLRTTTDQHRQKLWSFVESSIAPAPWFLGGRFSALDLYVGAMVHWRPRQEWFRAECPRLSAVAAKAGQIPAVQALFREQLS